MDVLDKKVITAIGQNEKRNTIYIYTNGVVPKKDRAAMPQTVDDFLVEYLQARNVLVGGSPDDSAADPMAWRNGGVHRCGSSISIGNDRMAGTLGCLVRGEDGKLYGLSNNHVTGGCNNSRPGLPIVGPGILDVMAGSPDPITVGFHSRALRMHQGEPDIVQHTKNTDAALFEILDESRVSSSQAGQYDTPSLVVDIDVDMEVEKVGRTTGHTTGVVESLVVGPFPVAYRSKTYHSPDEQTEFVGTVYFEPVLKVAGDRGPFSSNGDSGSLVVTTLADGQRAAVGLVFAGNKQGESWILPLRPILEGLGVSLVSNHNI